LLSNLRRQPCKRKRNMWRWKLRRNWLPHWLYGSLTKYHMHYKRLKPNPMQRLRKCKTWNWWALWWRNSRYHRLSSSLWWLSSNLALWEWHFNFPWRLHSSLWRQDPGRRRRMWRWQQGWHRHLLKSLQDQAIINDLDSGWWHHVDFSDIISSRHHIAYYYDHQPTWLFSLFWPILLHPCSSERTLKNSHSDWKPLKYIRSQNPLAKFGPIQYSLLLVPQIWNY